MKLLDSPILPNLLPEVGMRSAGAGSLRHVSGQAGQEGEDTGGAGTSLSL